MSDPKIPYVPTELLEVLRKKYPVEIYHTISTDKLPNYQGKQEVLSQLEHWHSMQSTDSVFK